MNNTNIVEFEFGEDIRTENREKQDEKWANAVLDGRVHLSNREANVFYRGELIRAIEIYYLILDVIRAFHDPGSYFKMLNHEVVRTIFEFAFEGVGPLVTVCVLNQYKSIARTLADNEQIDCPFRICVRKRPMMSWERETNAYDVVNSDTSLSSLTPNIVTIHNGRLARSGRQLSMTHLHYFVSRYFSELDSNEDVSSYAIEPHMRWAEQGNDSTILFYGQTGTGKTHSMLGTLAHIASRLSGRHVDLTFYEIRGKKCYDLLNQRTIVNVRADDQNNVHVRGCRTISLESLEPQDFLHLLNGALLLRTSAETERNPLSSRSHAICTIELYGAPQGSEESFYVSVPENEKTVREQRSKIRLVDLAGSERNYETWSMTAEDHRDSADINFTLMALKDCFRAYNYERSGKVPIGSLTGFAAANDTVVKMANEDLAKMIDREGKENEGTLQNLHRSSVSSSVPKQTKAKTKKRNVITTGSRFTKAPYRASLLTRILRECFVAGSSHKTTIIATVSPTPTDLEHTLNTLEHVSMMDPSLQSLATACSVELSMGTSSSPNAIFYDTPVHEWTTAQLTAWLSCAEGGRFSHLALPSGIDGATLFRQEVASLSAMFTGELRQARTEKEGGAWIEEVELNRRQEAIGKALWRALRREQQAYVVRRRQL